MKGNIRTEGRVKQKFEDRGEMGVITAWPPGKRDAVMETVEGNHV